MKDQSPSQLLSFVVSRWSNRTEDIAVDALGFILSRSRATRTALRGVVATAVPEIGELTHAKTQVVGNDGGRPDLAVYDNDGRERIVIEAKFWAGLTEKQPVSYLDRLPDDGAASVLLFVAPEARLETLWIELCRRTQCEHDVTDTSEVAGIKCMPINVGQRNLMLMSWRLVLDQMLTLAVAETDPIECDIRQLQALCEQEDSEAFLPIKAGEFAPAIPRRIEKLYDLLNDAIERTRELGFANTAGLRRSGWGRYLRLGRADANLSGGAWFGISLDCWARHAETPLWLSFSAGSTWGKNVATVDMLKGWLGEETWANTPNSIPVHLPIGVEYDAVLDAVVDQLSKLAARIAEAQ